MIYGTGGAAWQQIAATVVCNDTLFCKVPPGVSAFAITDSTTRLGYTAGSGIEAMVANHWLIRAEYRYPDFGTIQNTDVPCDMGACTPATSLSTAYRLRLATQTATFGLAYKF